MDCFKAGAIVGFNVVRIESNDGLFKVVGLTGSGIFTGSSTFSMSSESAQEIIVDRD